MADASTLPDSLTNWYASQTATPNASTSGGLLSATPSSNSTAIPGATAAPEVAMPVTSQTGILSGSTSNVPAGQPAYTASAYTPSLLDKPASWDITKNQTVAGQLDANLNSNSPLMQQAQNEGAVVANSRGLLNSSMAAQAGENAMISKAMPIATADAATNSTAASYNTNEANTFAQNNQNAQNTAAQSNTTAKNVADNTNTGNAFQATQNVYKAGVDSSLADLNNNANMNQAQLSNGQQLSQGFNNNVQAIQSNPNMTQATKDYNISQLYQTYQAQMKMLGSVGLVPNVADLLSNPAPNASAPDAGTISGPAPAPTPPPAAAASGGSVICTHYHDIGWMDDETYATDDKFLSHLLETNPALVAWYWWWAVPFTKWLKKSQLLTFIVWPFINAWAEHMKQKVDSSKKGSFFGKCVYAIGFNTFTIMSKFKCK